MANNREKRKKRRIERYDSSDDDEDDYYRKKKKKDPEEEEKVVPKGWLQWFIETVIVFWFFNIIFSNSLYVTIAMLIWISAGMSGAIFNFIKSYLPQWLINMITVIHQACKSVFSTLYSGLSMFMRCLPCGICAMMAFGVIYNLITLYINELQMKSKNIE